MSDDLVERLRAISVPHILYPLVTEAADEIERLQAALSHIKAVAEQAPLTHEPWCNINFLCICKQKPSD